MSLTLFWVPCLLEELQPSTLVQVTVAPCELLRWAAGEALFPVISPSLPALY